MSSWNSSGHTNNPTVAVAVRLDGWAEIHSLVSPTLSGVGEILEMRGQAAAERGQVAIAFVCKIVARTFLLVRNGTKHSLGFGLGTPR